MEYEGELEMVHRHVREGQAIVKRQAALVARLEKKGLDTEQARRLLERLTDLQAQHQDHLDRILRRRAEYQ